MPGFERGRNLDKMGQHAQDTAELCFDGVRVPVANLLGDGGQRASPACTQQPGARAALDRRVGDRRRAAPRST